MKKFRKMRERIISIVLAFAMVMTLLMSNVEDVYASGNVVYEPLIINSTTLNASTVCGRGDSTYLMDADGGFFSSACQADGALPDDGKITTSDGMPYQLSWTGSSPYADKDSIRFKGTRSGSYVTSSPVTMKISTYGVYDKVAILGTAGGFADQGQSLNFKVTLTYADNTYTEATYNLYDWYKEKSYIDNCGMGYAVFKRLNKNGTIDDYGSNGGPMLQSKTIECDETKVLKNITFQIAYTAASVANEYGIYAAIYAVTGVIKSGAPASPVITSQAVNSNSIKVEWLQVEGAVSYTVDVSKYKDFQDAQGEASFVEGYLNKSVEGTSAIIEGLETNTTYYCRVRAVGTDGAQSKNSDYDEVKTKVPTITLDSTNYADGHVSIKMYDSGGNPVEEGTTTLPIAGKVRVFAEGEFVVIADGATVGEVQIAGEEGYWCEITNFTKDTTVIVNKLLPHVHDEVTYVPMRQNSLQTAGNYYLTKDMTLNNEINISGTVNLCLNGHVLTASSIKVSNGATLNVLDCGTTEHKYTASDTVWTLDASGDKVISGGILCSSIENNGTFNLNDGTICGVTGVAINNKGTASIGENGAVIGSYNNTREYDENNTPTTIPAIVYNGRGATFTNSGKINNNVANIHTVCNDGGEFTNQQTGTINNNTAISTEEGTAAGGVANYTRNTSYISKFHNYGKINNNTSARSSGGVLNKGGEFTNYSTGQINGNTAAKHCGGVDNTSNALSGEYIGTFFKNYGQVNGNKALGINDGGDGAGIYNEVNATIYNYGEVCENIAKYKGGGIYLGSGTLIVGGKSKVTGNTDNSEMKSNICVVSGKKINFDSENKLVAGATMGIYLYDNGRIDGAVSNGYTSLYQDIVETTYFFADTSTQRVVLKNDEVYLETHTHEMIEATCTSAKKCKVSGCGYTEGESLGHKMIEATCTEAKKCQREGCEYTEGTALGHNMSSATCTSASKCKRDGCEYVGTALGHNMSEATCTDPSKCKRCGYTKGTALGHEMNEATCTEKATCKRTGCDYTKEALGHDWSGEWTVTKEATAKEEGTKETICVRGCGQKKVAMIPITGESNDDGNLEKDTEITPDAPINEATLNTTKDELLAAENILTDEEKKLIEEGEDARVWLEISKTDEDDIALEDKTKIEEEASQIMGDNPNITYFDADLFKQIGNKQKVAITEPGVAMKITIAIPEKLLNHDKTLTRIYKVIRLHNGQVDIIDGVFDPKTGEFSFESDRFSTYAIAYSDIPNEGGSDDEDSSKPSDDKGESDDKDSSKPSDNRGGLDDEGGSNSSDDKDKLDDEDGSKPSNDKGTSDDKDISIDAIKPMDDNEDGTPETGDSNKTWQSFVWLLFSGLGLIFCYRQREELSKKN